jgi:Putative metallopeptidase family (DUF6782)
MSGPAPLPSIPMPSWLGARLGDARGRDVEPGPGPSPPAGGGAAADDAKKLQDIKDLLKKSATGAAAVKFFEDKGLKADFVKGGGSFWDGTRMVIDGNEGVQDAALTIVHEVHHAQTKLDGTKPDPKADTKPEYVRKMIEEEATGTVLSIQTKNELVAGGESVTATFPLESKYNEAYKKATEDLLKADPKASADALKAAGEKAGMDRVIKGFKDGEVVTSDRKIAYSDHYGQRWEGANKK